MHGARFYLCHMGKKTRGDAALPEGLQKLSVKLNKGKGPFSEVFNWTSLKASKKLYSVCISSPTMLPQLLLKKI